MRILIILVLSVIFFSSCSTYQATMSKHQNQQFEAIKAYPKWTYKKTKGKWILPALGLTGGAAYGYKTEFTYDEKLYKGKENAAIWGGIGLIGGALLNGLLFQNKGRNSYKFNVTQSKKWVQNYNKTTGSNYVLHGVEPDNAIIIIPKHRLADLKRYEEAQIDKSIARVKAEEDRIKLEQENRRIRQAEEIDNVAKRKNLVQHLNWNPITITGEKEVYPSALVTASTYTGPRSSRGNDYETKKRFSTYLGFDFQPEVLGGTVSYEIESSDNKFLGKSSGEIKIDRSGKIYPEINWKVNELIKNKSLKPLKVWFRLQDQEGNYVEKSLDLAILSINECIMVMNGKKIDWILPAYVNEQNLLIEGILKEALDKEYIDSWIGYQRDYDMVSVLKQIKAVWQVLEDRGFKYSSITGAGNYSQAKIFSQYIRTVGDAITSEQANCIDGTLLFASILKRLDINPYIILYPGHANLAFDFFEDKSQKVYLEMTMLGYSSFENTLIGGKKRYQKNTLDEKRILDIGEARKAGIKPLGI